MTSPHADPGPAGEPPRQVLAPKRLPRVFTLAAAVVVIAALRFGRDVFFPLALSVLLSFMLAPLATRLERLRLGRVPSVLTLVSAVALAMATIGWFVFGQVSALAAKLPEYRSTLHEKLDDVRDTFGQQFGKTAVLVQELEQDLDGGAEPASTGAVHLEVDHGPSRAASWIQGALRSVTSALVFAGILFLFVTFMLLQRDGLRDRFIWMIGDHQLNVTTKMLEEASSKVRRYLLAQLVVNGIHGVLVGVGLAFLDVPDALLWGLVAAILRFVPYVGPWVAAICPILVSFAVFDDWSGPLMTVALFVVLELFTNNVLEPHMYAAKTGMSPLAILVSALFWTWLWGAYGLVLATPLTACLVVMGKYVPQLRAFAVVLGDEPVLSPAVRLYQRVLADDYEGAWEVLGPQLEGRSLLEVYDSVLLPALCLSAVDSRSAAFETRRGEEIQRTLAALVEDAAEDEAAGAAPSPARPFPRGGPLRVLCVPTTDAADEAAASMLCAVLRREGMGCEVLSAAYLAGEIPRLVAEMRPEIICLSHVPPPLLAPLRYLCKRLVATCPGVPILLGAWTSDADLDRAELRLPRQGELFLAGTLSQARSHVLQLVQQVRLTRPPAEDAAAEHGTDPQPGSTQARAAW